VIAALFGTKCRFLFVMPALLTENGTAFTRHPLVNPAPFALPKFRYSFSEIKLIILAGLPCGDSAAEITIFVSITILVILLRSFLVGMRLFRH